MSLNMATGSLKSRLPKNDAVDSLTNGNVGSTVQKPQKQLDATTNNLTGVVLPGDFPGNEDENEQETIEDSTPFFTSLYEWARTLIPATLDKFESAVKWFICWLFPPPRQAALYAGALRRPIATTFIVCQLICCGVPLLVFLAGLFVFAAVAILLWAILSFVILGPILLVTSCTGVCMWGWGWILYGLIKWIDQKYLGGVITRFWLSQAPTTGDDDDEQPREQPPEEEKKES